MAQVLNAALIAERLDEFAERHHADFGLEIDTGYECGWGCELRWTAEPNKRDGVPDESVVLYAIGSTPDEAVGKCFMSLLERLPEPSNRCAENDCALVAPYGETRCAVHRNGT